jgi:hypothetical protein
MEANDRVLSSGACVSNYSLSLMIEHYLAASFTQKIPMLSKTFAKPISWRYEALNLHIPVPDAVWRDREDHSLRVWHRKGCKEGSRWSRLTQRQTLDVIEARKLARKEISPPSCEGNKAVAPPAKPIFQDLPIKDCNTRLKSRANLPRRGLL